MKRRTLLTLLGGATLLPVRGLVQAAGEAPPDNVTVTAVGVKYEPMFVHIPEGGTVNWEGMAAHNVETMPALCVEGGTEANTELGANVSITFADIPGLYVYKCTPHWGSRMGGVILVGSPPDLGAILDGYMSKIETEKGDLLPAKGLVKKARKEMESIGLV